MEIINLGPPRFLDLLDLHDLLGLLNLLGSPEVMVSEEGPVDNVEEDEGGREQPSGIHI